MFSGKLYQTLRGRIIDAESRIPLEVVTVVLSSVKNKGTYTDQQGRFVLYDIPIGRHTLMTSYLGYESIVLPELELKSAKELTVDVEMVESVNKIEAVEIVPENVLSKPVNSMSMGFSRKFSAQEAVRYPGGTSDSAWMAQSYAEFNNHG